MMFLLVRDKAGIVAKGMEDVKRRSEIDFAAGDISFYPKIFTHRY
jgi:hypothetical protein